MRNSSARSAIVILLIAAALVAGHMVPGLDHSRVEDGIRNALHIVVFAAFAGFIFGHLRLRGILFAATIAIATAAVVGGLAEMVQTVFGRPFDLVDVVRDLSGAALAVTGGVLWIGSSTERVSGWLRHIARAASIVLGVAILSPLIFWISIVTQGRLLKPVILDFDQWWDHYTYRPINAEIKEEMGSAEIQLLKRGRSGIVVSPLTADWSEYRFLTFSARMASGADTRVSVRINDSDRRNSWSDEFLAWSTVVQETTQIRIPFTDLADEPGHAMMDLTNIQEIVIFGRDRRANTTMIIDNIRLE